MTLGPVLVGIDGIELTEASREQLLHPLVGGVVLFTRNYENRGQLVDLIQSIRELRNPRLLLAVDQEGGRVQRFREGFTRLPPLGSLGHMHSSDTRAALEHAYWHGRVMAMEMLDLGIDISFTPVLDLDRGSSVIGDRAFAGQPETVVELADAYLRGMHEAGMRSTGKHFPGHGSVVADSHIADVCDNRSLEEIESSDMKPFTSLAGDLDAMMIAHVEYPCLDDKPAGYSQAWLAGQLRERMGYKGVIFSDDLGMHAAKTLTTLEQRTVASLEAGCDAVLVCQPEDVSTLLDEWSESLETPNMTSALQALYGLPVLPAGSLAGSQSEDADHYRSWRKRLERLAERNLKGKQYEPE